MRIAHLFATGGWGGAELLASALARQAKAEGDTVVVDAAPLAQSGLSTQGLISAGRESRLLPWAMAAHQRLKQFKPDIVHAHLSTPAFSAAMLLAVGRLPCVATLHLLPEREWPNDFLAPVSCAITLRLATVRPFRMRLVAVSASNCNAIARRVGTDTVNTIVNAPAPCLVENTQVGASGIFEGAAFKLLAIGRLERQKGFDRLISALSGRSDQDIDFRLAVVGAGPELQALQEQCKGASLSNRVHFAGAVSGRPLMKEADLVVCSSRYEGMPLVPMEAVLAGCPVVVSSIEAHRELFGDVPDAILPDAASDWGHTLRALMSDATRLARLKASQAPLAPGFSFQRMWSEYCELYKRVVAQS